MFKHFLVTPFNLLSFPMGIEDQKKWEEWTVRRIDLFKYYCLPSLEKQSNKDFTWLIYFDAQTPEVFKPFMEELKQYKFIEVGIADGFVNFKKEYPQYIKAQCKEEEWVMISRIDNDDCFHNEAIEVIRRNFRPSDRFLISLASGYTLNHISKELSHYFYPMSPFITIIEKTSKKQLEGIFSKPHSAWDELRLFLYKEIFGRNRKSKFVLEKPYWIQVVHEENLCNSFRRGLPVLHERKLDAFGIDIVSTRQSLRTIPSYFNYVLWKRYFKALLVRMLKSDKSRNIRPS